MDCAPLHYVNFYELYGSQLIAIFFCIASVLLPPKEPTRLAHIYLAILLLSILKHRQRVFHYALPS